MAYNIHNYCNFKVLRERKINRGITQNGLSKEDEKSFKLKTSIDLFLDLSKTDPTFTEHELLSEINVLILAVSRSKFLIATLKNSFL